MSIVRSARRKNFTTLDNAVFTAGLSYRAMGLLAYLLSKPDHWEVSVSHLVNVVAESARPDGRDSIYAVLNELMTAGFMTREQVRTDGKMAGYTYEVFDVPQSPFPAEPDTAAPNTAEPTQVNTDKPVNTETQKTPHTPSGGEWVQSVSELFDLFWGAYPRKVGKDAARRAFEKRKPDRALLESMLQALTVARSSRDWTREGGRFIPHPATWLNQGRWQDEIEPGQNGGRWQVNGVDRSSPFGNDVDGDQ